MWRMDAKNMRSARERRLSAPRRVARRAGRHLGSDARVRDGDGVSEHRLELIVPPELVEAIAARAAAIVVARSEPSRWMTVEEAAEYARCSRQHIYDLRSDGRLGRHGERGHALVDRRELDVYLDGTVP
jgi:excisionase family DNA binding protein